MKKSMLRRLFLTITIILFVTIGLALLVGRVVVQKHYVQIKVEELKPKIQAVADEISQTGKSVSVLNQFEFIVKAYDTLKNEMDIFDPSVLPIKLPDDEDGNISMEDQIKAAIAPYINTVLMGNELSEITNLNGLQGTSVMIGIPIKREGKIIGAAFLLKPVSDFSSALNGFYMTFLISGLILFVLLLGFLYFALQRLIAPLNKMTSSAYHMASGDYSLRIQELGYGEVEQLATSFNTLACSLEEASKLAKGLEQTRRDYVANISHELRTPIASLRAMAETLLDAMIPTEDEKKRYYQKMLTESIRLQNLINDMLELSKLQSGQAFLEKSIVDTGALLKRTYERFSEIADDMDLVFTFDLDVNEVPKCYTNQARIEQVLIILIDNAFKFTPENGCVTLSAVWDETTITVEVQDTGQGIAQSDLPYVFERFYKVDKAHSERGTGLGLAIAQQIMWALDEKIKVSSQIGVGTCFSFTLKRT